MGGGKVGLVWFLATSTFNLKLMRRLRPPTTLRRSSIVALILSPTSISAGTFNGFDQITRGFMLIQAPATVQLRAPHGFSTQELQE
ncbi:unnamed protein product [Musa acuminata subsp. malaccensis]|uniref:(wild Malaysian banana) hypothetical protein n=1 Tax=Musa acuminata subsp. malaccensis TaxID=214687 RepID=A0A804KRL0_MUSAM|nr:unnamed protein product [Musa acuminata subsp. malaccensis]